MTSQMGHTNTFHVSQTWALWPRKQHWNLMAGSEPVLKSINNGREVPRVGEVQALPQLSVKQPAGRKATPTQGAGGKGERLKQQCCFFSRFMQTEHKSTSLPARLTLPVPSPCKAGGDKALTVVTSPPSCPGAQDTAQRSSTCIPLFFCSLSIFISSFLPLLILQGVSWSLFKGKENQGSISHTPSYDLVKPTTCGHFSLPDTASSSNRLKHCQALQHTQGRAGSWSLPTAAEPRCSFSQARRKDSPGWPKDGMANWTVWAARIYSYYLTTAAAIPFLVLLELWERKYISLFSWSKTKKEPTKAIQVISQYLQPWETAKAFPSPGTSICSSS